MLYETKLIPLKNGKTAILRAPSADDAAEMTEYLKKCADETEFILRYPEECTETTEQETQYLQNLNNSEYNIMIVCEVDGRIAGNCQIMFNRRIKTKHRASIAIAILQEFWNLGIGTAMFGEMIDFSKQRGITQLELDFIEGNERAKHLYKKMGFVIIAERPDAIRLRDGTMLKEFTMTRKL